MQATFTFNLGDGAPPLCVQLLDLAARLNDSTQAPIAATHSGTGHVQQQVQAPIITPPASAQEQPQPVGAVPPGIEAPAKRRGRPSKAELEARAAAVAEQAPVPVSPSPAAVAPASNGFRPPGVTLAPVAQLQQPAMPAVDEEEYSDGMITKEDVKDCFAKAVVINPNGVRTMLKASTWPSDGSAKPQWYVVDNVAPVHFDRLIRELSAFIPQE